MMSIQWYALRSKPNKEEALWREISMRGLEVYYPQLRVRPVNPRARKLRPYFPGYLFVHIDLVGVGFSTLSWMPYSRGLVSFGIAPSPTSEVLLTNETVVASDCGGGIMMVKTAPSEVNYRAYVVPISTVPHPLPNIPITCAIKVLAITTTNLSSDTLVCWPILSTQAGSAYYYNGSQWVQTLFLNVNNQLCNNYVPGNAPNPLYVVVFSTEPTGAQVPITGGAVVPPGGRPSGTVVTNPLQIPVTGQTSPLAGCTWVFSAIESPPVGVNYSVHFVPETDLPTPFPGILVSCPVKVTAVVSNNLGAKTLVCWPMLPVQAGFAYYYDGSKWVKTNPKIADNQICADVVSDTAPNPAFVAVFDR